MYKKILVGFSTSLILFGCGGGSDGGSTPPSVTPTPPPPPALTLSDIAGIYDGTVSREDGTNFEIVGIFSEGGEARFLTLGQEQLSGQVSIDGDDINVSLLSFFSEFGYDGTSIISDLVDSGTAKATYNDGTIAGTTDFGGFTSSFSMAYDAADSNIVSSLSALSGNYVTEDFNTAIAIDEDGVISGSDVIGCVYNGNVTAPNSNINVYELTVSIDNCNIPNNTFSGLGAYFPATSDTVDYFIFQADNGSVAITTLIIKN
jgi:hypothetical protein